LVGGFALLFVSVLAGNYLAYRVLLTNEFKYGEFPRAYGAMLRVKSSEWQRYIFFPRDAAEAVFSVSSAARELQPYLGIDRNGGWRTVGCEELRLDPCPIGIAGGWFVWAVRSAAAEAGHFKSARSAQAYFRRLAQEINAACAEGRIACTAERDSMAPPFRVEYVELTLHSAAVGMRRLLDFGKGEAGWNAMPASPAEEARFSRIVGRIPRPAKDASDDLVVEGWIAADGVPGLAIEDAAGASSRTTLSMTPADDVQRKFQSGGWQDVHATRFRLETDCRRPTCRLILTRSGDGSTAIPLDRFLASRGQIMLDSWRFQVTEKLDKKAAFRNIDVPALEAFFQKLNRFAHIYSIVFTVLGAMAIPGALLWYFVRRKDSVAAGTLAMFVLVSAVAVLSRIGLLAYIDASSWRALHTLYLAPATPFMIIVAICGSFMGWRAILILRNPVPR
jgi:hypothetical protein